ncbi:hypothetical protein GUJ93_ZPchr0006g42536 [Zizania palustris]|uniref:Uncharacterized protein n=1 Tax=Zizania palustris TaxID=103762 RepID=A0A8J5TFP0_ZIZPA|nr:hypothetical protein GUJ93_ZPchr0006g42536 [Zizania palustris]
MRDLGDLLSKPNPMAEELIPPSLAAMPAPGPTYGYNPTNGGGFMLVSSPTGHSGIVGFPSIDGLRGHGWVRTTQALFGRLLHRP